MEPSSVAVADEELEALERQAYDAAGVDLTQIDFMLSLSPRQRLEALFETARSLARLTAHADAHEVL